jgi:AAA+ ATPase superfamily predicted ATPase
MKFYNRQQELNNLKEIELSSKNSSKMSIIYGRRRVGKTTLVKKAYDKKVYLFVSKKNEALLVQEFVLIIENELDTKILGEFKSFVKLFEYLLILSQTKPFTLIIDEFQEFFYINSSIFSDIQNLWDEYKDSTKLNLIFCGSIYSLMKKIFENQKEPLFNRANNKILLKPFKIDTLQEYMIDNNPSYTPMDMLALYIFSGGVAKYLEIFYDKGSFSYEDMLKSIFAYNSLFIDEGKNILIEEFGKEYTTYFSILSLIASSKTSRSEIESILEKNIGGYLDRLENEYSIIKKIKPILAKEGSRNVKYEIIDNFLAFWFRFVFKYKSAVEIENYEFLQELVRRDFNTFAGKFLEKYIKEKLSLTKRYSIIGSYWERGNKNEIDIVAVDELNKNLLIAEVKLNKNKINLNLLEQKSKNLIPKFKDYHIEYKGFSLEDVL